MGILCRLGQHRAAPQVRSNGGASFGLCAGCGCGLVLSATGWRPVPRGYRLVWRSEPPERAADPRQLPLDLPEPAWALPGARRIARPATAPPRPSAPRTGRALARVDSARITA
ncbi:MAG TPA: hypothetical protein VFQ67_11360 [Allosphingosinicella sp.]|jgi:hypothetical protein|nr:hypothetical protein [Allosphingosinicella sp.]